MIEDIPPIEFRATEHVVNDYWCSKCKKIVSAKVTDALPNAKAGLPLNIYTLRVITRCYLEGLSLSDINQYICHHIKLYGFVS